MSHYRLISIIIPTTKKEEKILGECLQAIHKSTYKNFEIIVVNEGKERSVQRNIGIDHARGDYLLFLDSDQLISPYLLMECIYKMPLCDAFYIPEKIVTKGFFGYLRNWERQFYTGTPIDCVRFVKAKDCPRFDELLSGPEDADFDRKIKCKKLVTLEGLEHKDNIGFIQYMKKKAYYSKSMKRYAEKWPNDKVLNLWWRVFGVYLEKGSYKRVIQRPDLFLCLMFLNLIRGIIYASRGNYA